MRRSHRRRPTARMVFDTPNGQKLVSAEKRAEVEPLVAELQDTPQVASVADPSSSQAMMSPRSLAAPQLSQQ